MPRDGYAEVKDRAKRSFSPAAAVVAMPDDKYDERPCAFVALEGDGTAGALGIIAWCRDGLAHFKAPIGVVFGSLPKTSTGKIEKFALRERARQP